MVVSFMNLTSMATTVPPTVTHRCTSHRVTPPSSRLPQPTEPVIIDLTDSEQSKFETTRSYHIQTRLADGRPALVIDPGSVGNLSGDAWAKEAANAAARHGQTPSCESRGRLLSVTGVSNGTQACEYDCKLPVALRQADGGTVSIGHITTPTVSSSMIPGLLGLTALRKNRAIIDFNTLRLCVCVGLETTIWEQDWPPGTDCFQRELAPLGHPRASLPRVRGRRHG